MQQSTPRMCFRIDKVHDILAIHNAHYSVPAGAGLLCNVMISNISQKPVAEIAKLNPRWVTIYLKTFNKPFQLIIDIHFL